MGQKLFIFLFLTLGASRGFGSLPSSGRTFNCPVTSNRCFINKYCHGIAYGNEDIITKMQLSSKDIQFLEFNCSSYYFLLSDSRRSKWQIENLEKEFRVQEKRLQHDGGRWKEYKRSFARQYLSFQQNVLSLKEKTFYEKSLRVFISLILMEKFISEKKFDSQKFCWENYQEFLESNHQLAQWVFAYFNKKYPSYKPVVEALNIDALLKISPKVMTDSALHQLPQKYVLFLKLQSDIISQLDKKCHITLRHSDEVSP